MPELTTTTLLPADDRVGPPIVRDAVRRAVSHNVRERVEEARRLGSATAESPTEAPSPELVRLLTNLQYALTHYVRGRRDEGMPVDRVLREAALLVREAESCEGWLDPSNTLSALVVRWSVMAYNDGAEEA